MARTILNTFGRDSILASVRDPFRFIRQYAAARHARASEDPFSPSVWRVISQLEETARLGQR